MSFFGSLLILALVLVVAFVFVGLFKNGVNPFSNFKFPTFNFPTFGEQKENQEAAIAQADEELEQSAIDENFNLGRGLTARQERALATDRGSVVIGSSNNEVNFGVIGGILPTDPSPFFIANKEILLTPEELKRFNREQAEREKIQSGGGIIDQITNFFNPDKKEEIAKEGFSKERDPKIPINLDQVIAEQQSIFIGPPKPAMRGSRQRFS